jgi:hypothetical protein
MKKESEQVHINVPPSTHALLLKACEAEKPQLTLGQIVTKLAYEKYGHLEKPASQPQAEGYMPPKEEIEKSARHFLERYGSREAAVDGVPKGLPRNIRLAIIEAINNLG